LQPSSAVDLDLGLGDDLGALCHFVGDELREVLGGRADRLEAELVELLPDRGLGDDSRDLGLQLGDDAGREILRPPRRERRYLPRRAHAAWKLRQNEIRPAAPRACDQNFAGDNADFLLQRKVLRMSRPRSRARSTAAPTVGWPANRSSVVGVKIRIAARFAACLAGRTNTVSDKLNSLAIRCMVAVSSPSESRTTASGFPANASRVKTSRTL
jgi:hypothetical protein